MYVTICTLNRPKQDQTTVLQGTDHPFVRVPSCAEYRFTGLMLDSQTIHDHLTRGIYVRQPDFSPSLLGRLQAGVAKSKYTPKDMKAWIQARPHLL